jgi:very-short-patch-repair endonuclease
MAVEMTKDTYNTDEQSAGLPNREAIELSRLFIKRWAELVLGEIDQDLAKIAAHKGDDVNEMFDELVARAKWNKRVDLLLATGPLFERRYGTPRGELNLVREAFGEQLGLKMDPAPEDIRQRLEWYRKRLGVDYERRIVELIESHSISSPIEQLFAMEWHYLGVSERLGVVLTPQHEVIVDGLTYRLDFSVTRPSSNLKIAIELDGHQFHERTPEQARKDKGRERVITRQGYIFHRFAGGEVMRSPKKCVNEVEDLIQKQL